MVVLNRPLFLSISGIGSACASLCITGLKYFVLLFTEKIFANHINFDIYFFHRLYRMPEHVGFGHAVYTAVQMCQTDYVMVVQHDHPFSLKFRLFRDFISRIKKGSGFLAIG